MQFRIRHLAEGNIIRCGDIWEATDGEPVALRGTGARYVTASSRLRVRSVAQGSPTLADAADCPTRNLRGEPAHGTLALADYRERQFRVIRWEG